MKIMLKIMKKKSRRSDSNTRPMDLQSTALPTELLQEDNYILFIYK